jgi:nucleoside triphosphate diphosphatase
VNDKQSDAFERVMDLVRFLRAHCPWDAAQTPRSLIPYLLEEAHEVADALADEDDTALRTELGDLMLNLAFQLVLAEERAAFGADAVADTVIDKMRRRHPHLYGLGDAVEWEKLKARERDAGGGVLHGVARGLDPLSKAHRIQDRVARVGFDWADATGAWAKVAEELEEVREAMAAMGQPSTSTSNRADALEEELGDLLFAVVNLTRLAGAHALTALHAANRKFTRRFESLEALAAARGMVLEDASLAELDRLWDEVKGKE